MTLVIIDHRFEFLHDTLTGYGVVHYFTFGDKDANGFIYYLRDTCTLSFEYEELKGGPLIKCRIFWDTNLNSYIVQSKFNERLVEGLKNIIPSGQRHWDPQNKAWYVDETWGEPVRKIAEACLGQGTVSFVSRTVSQQYTQQQNSQAFTPSPQTGSNDVLELFGLFTYDAVRKAYLLTCQTLHPDKQGGDATKMSRLNELWQKVEKNF